MTRKHLNTIKYNENARKNAFQENYTCDCGKSYPYKASLYNHKKKCFFLEQKNKDLKDENIIIKNSDGEIDYKSMFLNIVKENKELHNVLITQQNQIGELIPKLGNNNTINNTINKQKFNINIFLNEQCKDALTMNEFIDRIKITLDDLMLTKNKGLCEGVSNIFIENMNKLSIHERPMHCTDVKRETLYIKCDGVNNNPAQWSKDESNNLFKEAINKVGHIQRKQINLWTDKHPKWQNNSKEQEEYMLLIKNCTDDLKENKREDKIIKKLCNIVHLSNE
tara:strand:+ start:1522 stop:2361 length:840 start_codon:yes stop_codon:yes gene_type:complete